VLEEIGDDLKEAVKTKEIQVDKTTKKKVIKKASKIKETEKEDIEDDETKVLPGETIQEDVKPIVQIDISKNKYLEEMSVDEAEHAEEVHDKMENDQKEKEKQKETKADITNKKKVIKKVSKPKEATKEKVEDDETKELSNETLKEDVETTITTNDNKNDELEVKLIEKDRHEPKELETTTTTKKKVIKKTTKKDLISEKQPSDDETKDTKSEKKDEDVRPIDEKQNEVATNQQTDLQKKTSQVVKTTKKESHQKALKVDR